MLYHNFENVPVTITIPVKYTCTLCGLRAVTVAVPARMDPDKEEVEAWVERTLGNAVGADHRRRSPECVARKLSNIMIPIPKGDDAWIGKPEQH